MKKAFALALIFCTLSCFAEDIKDTWFDMFAKAAAKKVNSGISVRRDDATRTLFFDFPLPIKSSNGFNCAEAKNAIVKGIKASPDAEYIKKTEMLIIYNYITADYKIFSVVISKKDF